MGNTQLFQGMLLAAGLATRLRPLTYHIPKPVLPVLNRPLLHHHLHFLSDMGVQQVVINLHHLADQVQHCAESFTGIERILFSKETVLRGTGGAIDQAKHLFTKQTLLLINSDIIFHADLRKMFEFHKKKGALVTLLLRKKEAETYGALGVNEDGRIVSFPPTKPAAGVSQQGMFTGIHLIEPDLFPYFNRPNQAYCIVRELYTPLCKAKAPLYAWFMEKDDYWNDLGTGQRLLSTNFDLLHRIASNREEYRIFWDSSSELDVSTDGTMLLKADSAIIDDTARLSGRVIVGKEVHIGKNTSLCDCMLLDHSRIGVKQSSLNAIIWPKGNIQLSNVKKTEH